jgi:triosephosphate isomerase
MVQFSYMSHLAYPLVVGNWKMNPVTFTEAKHIVTGTKAAAKKYPRVTVVVAPPSLFLSELKKLLGSSSLKLGAQTMHQAPCGAHTGEVSAGMLAAFGVEYVILGHSERRMLGETDEMVNQKVTTALKAKLIPIICIGERKRDTQGNFYTHIETQVSHALSGVPKTRLKDIVIAYEPIWAIGTGLTASAEDVREMQLFINKIITKIFDRSSATHVRIIYGGSVTAETAAELYRGGGVQGFLVGGASLKSTEFTKIIAAAV